VYATGLSLIAIGCLIGATPRGQPWTSAVTLPHGRNGLIAWRMAVLYTFREPSLCRQVHREFMRSTVLDVTAIISATACHQRSQWPPAKPEAWKRWNRSKRWDAV